MISIKSKQLIEAATDAKLLIDACETDDEIGFILRFHLKFESLLSLYLSEKLVGDIASYIAEPDNYAGKLKFSIAFGLPLQMAAVFKHVNKIRNGVAHNSNAILNHTDIKQLAKLVNGLAELNPSFAAVEKRYITLPTIKQGYQFRFGNDGLRYDFIICCMSFYGEVMSQILTMIEKTSLQKK